MNLRLSALFVLTTLMNAPTAAQPVTEQALWGGDAPAADRIGDYEDRSNAEHTNRWLTGVETPVVSLHHPAAGRATGAAVVVFPGGGYSGVAIDKEGHFVAQWLAERGVLGVVVPYRCGGGAHRHPVPLSDAQRAIRLVRSQADALGVDPAKIGVMGFSAGGHLAATSATLFDKPLQGVDDSLAKVSARPDFAVLVYPVISLRPDISHGGSATNLIGENPDEALVAGLSADEQVTPQTPPTLIIHSIDDGSVPVANAQRFYDACRKNKASVEMHLYETGGHGYGMWATQGSVAAWPAVLEGWLAGRGYTAPTK